MATCRSVDKLHLVGCLYMWYVHKLLLLWLPVFHDMSVKCYDHLSKCPYETAPSIYLQVRSEEDLSSQTAQSARSHSFTAIAGNFSRLVLSTWQHTTNGNPPRADFWLLWPLPKPVGSTLTLLEELLESKKLEMKLVIFRTVVPFVPTFSETSCWNWRRFIFAVKLHCPRFLR